MKVVVVTGGSGWIGKYVVYIHLYKGDMKCATYNKNNPSHLPCHWHKVNLLRDDEVKQFISDVQPSHLIHLAWEAVPPACYISINSTIG